MSTVQRLVLWSILVTAASFAYHQTVIIDRDVGWYLVGAGKLANGARLYLDLSDTNPPLIFYIAMPAVLLARLIDIPVVTAFHLLLHALALSMLVPTMQILRRTPMVAAVLPLLVFAVPGFAFGQREHLFFVLALPWLAVVSRTQGRRDGPVIWPLLAGLGMLVKPYFAAMPLAVLVATAVNRRSLRGLFGRDALLLAALQLAYGLAVLLAFPAFFTEVVPELLAYYGAMDHGMEVVLRVRLHVLLMLALALVVVLRAAPDRRRRRTALVWLAAALGGLVAYAAQRKGWDYHALPAVLLTAVLLVQVAAWPRLAVTTRGALLAAVLVTVGFRYSALPSRAAFWSDAWYGFARHSPPTGLLVLSTSTRESFPLLPLADHLDWVLRQPNLWQLPGLLQRLASGRDDPLDTRTLAALRHTIADALQRHPGIVAADTVVLPGQPFDYRRFTMQWPEVAAAWNDYVLCFRHGTQEIWVRRDGPFCPDTR